MGINPAPAEENRVLLLPATSRDAAALGKLLTAAGLTASVCRDRTALAEGIDTSIGLIIIAEEHLSAGSDSLTAALAAQPVWSDLPVIVLSRSGTESPKLTSVLPLLGNATVLERPVRMSTLMTVVRSALRARQRQYEVRSHLAAMAEAERRRRDLLDAERQARNEAERASRMKDEFLATLSHELRTPLNAILGWSQILQMSAKDMPPDVAEGLGVIDRNARVQTQIIQDLLDMSRIISGKVLLDVKPMNLADLLRSAIDTVQPAAAAKRVRLTADLDGEKTTLVADTNRLQQVFWNLLNNAVKFTPAGGWVKITVEPSKEQVRVHVTDSGAGIAPDFLPHMFDRFRQADASTTRQHGGLGLGLSIVRQLVELHGGTVMARSDGPGRGSTFTVTLPTAASFRPATEDARPQSGPRNATAPPGGSLAGLRVLVVDDEADARNFVARLLENAEATVNTAANAAQAFEAVRTHRPDVLVTDIGMPGEDGYDLLRKVRNLQTDQGGRTPAIALTAYARSQDTHQILSAGFQTHLVKPVELSALTAAILKVKDCAAQV